MGYSPQVTCSFCGCASWKIAKSNPDLNAAEFLRVRVYDCQCGAKLYTHEYIIRTDRQPRPQGLLPIRISPLVCPECTHDHWRKREKIAEQKTSLREWLWVCAACGCAVITAEVQKVITEGPTPRNERGHRPHIHRYLGGPHEN